MVCLALVRIGADADFEVDPRYEEEVSGCTACIGLITKDKIFVVGLVCAVWRLVAYEIGKCW